MIIQLIILIFSIIGILISSNIAILFNLQENILLFLFIEFLSISIIFLLISILKKKLYPEKINLEEIFIGGVAKPPYIDTNEIIHPLRKEEKKNDRK
ncbi:MAG: hypothetical protein QXY18_05825 [Nitrososphaerota archaeon]